MPCRGAFYPFEPGQGEEKKPFLLCDGRMPQEMREKLTALGQVIALPPYEKLPLPVCGHPDLLCFYDGAVLYTFKEYYDENRSLFENLPCKVRPLDIRAGAYPRDLPFDQLLFCNAMIGREEFVPPELKEGRRMLSVKQGYAKCSALVFDGHMITADRGIAASGRILGGKVLEIEAGGIALEGYNTGFIGGASGVVGKNVLFFGSLSCHPQGKEIKAFVSLAGYEAEQLSEGPLVDHGGLLVIPQQGKGL